ncbi:DUF4129 domain-containing protein [Mycobacterium sp.]|uniref:DUF4129 domain-containing protein n=1 Tax=Mycobacterium sp. TaxID=1785 RepID=UPI0031E306AF
MSAIDVGRDDAHRAAQSELAKPIYSSGSPTQRFHDWVGQLLFRILDKSSSIPGGWFTLAVLLTLVLVAVLVAIRIARRAMRTSHGADRQLFDAVELTAARHRATAEAYAAKDNWSAAIRHRLRAVARELEETGVLNPAPGRTADELARDAGAALPHLLSELVRAATVFNDVAYGERPGTAALYQTTVELDDHLRYGPPAGPAAARQPLRPDSWAPAG